MSNFDPRARASTRVADLYQTEGSAMAVLIVGDVAHTISVGRCPDDSERWQATCYSRGVSVLARTSSRELVSQIATQWALVVGRWSA